MVSIIIVNWNTKSFLRACLASIQAVEFDQPLQTIVVDNASTDGSAQMVREEFSSVELIASDRNLGYAAGNNLGFSRATGDYILTLNPDTELYTNTITAALEALDSHPDCGALGACQIGTDGNIQHSIRGFPTLRGILGDLLGFGKDRPGTVWDSYRLLNFDYSRGQYAPQPMGTFLLFKRQALAKIGPVEAPFDEKFPIFFNEVDLLLRLNKAGEKCWYDPSVKLLHHGGEGTKQVRASMIWESHRSLARFMRKHYQTPWNAVFLWLFGELLSLAAFVRARGYHAGFRP